MAIIIAGLLACQNGSEGTSNSDSTTNSITPPPTQDTANSIAPMMGDTAKTEADSLKKKNRRRQDIYLPGNGKLIVSPVSALS